MSIKNNTTSLQSLLDTINNLPEASTTPSENLDEEISTQETLISEQNIKIAELAEVLANKSSGSYNSTSTIQISNNNGIGDYMFVTYLSTSGSPSKVKIKDGTSITIPTLVNSVITLIFYEHTNSLNEYSDSWFDYGGVISYSGVSFLDINPGGERGTFITVAVVNNSNGSITFSI